jgi:hypothetical protein
MYRCSVTIYLLHVICRDHEPGKFIYCLPLSGVLFPTYLHVTLTNGAPLVILARIRGRFALLLGLVMTQSPFTIYLGLALP